MGNPSQPLEITRDADFIIEPLDELTVVMLKESVSKGSGFGQKNGYYADILRPGIVVLLDGRTAWCQSQVTPRFFTLRAYPDNSRDPRDECHPPEPEAERPRISVRDTQGSDNEGGGRVPPSPSGLGPKSRPATLLVGHVSLPICSVARACPARPCGQPSGLAVSLQSALAPRAAAF